MGEVDYAISVPIETVGEVDYGISIPIETVGKVDYRFLYRLKLWEKLITYFYTQKCDYRSERQTD